MPDASVARQFLRLRDLPPGWDSYRADPVNRDTIRQGVRIIQALSSVVPEPTAGYPPSIVPRSNGGIQIEWHTDRWDIEITVDPDREGGDVTVEKRRCLTT